MKCITILKADADDVAAGRRRALAFTWPTDYRGPLAVAAVAEGRHVLADNHPADVVAWAELVDCRPMADTPADVKLAGCAYRDWRYLWLLGEPKPLARPVRVQGRRFLYDVDCTGILPAGVALCHLTGERTADGRGLVAVVDEVARPMESRGYDYGGPVPDLAVKCPDCGGRGCHGCAYTGTIEKWKLAARAGRPADPSPPPVESVAGAGLPDATPPTKLRGRVTRRTPDPPKGGGLFG